MTHKEYLENEKVSVEGLTDAEIIAKAEKFGYIAPANAPTNVEIDCTIKGSNATLADVKLVGDSPANDGVASGTKVTGQLVEAPIYSEFTSEKKKKNYGKWTAQFRTDTGLQEVNVTGKKVSIGKSYTLLKCDNFNALGQNYPKYQMLKIA
jgi:hypothetical protein